MSDNNSTFWVTLPACLLLGQENTVFSLCRNISCQPKPSIPRKPQPGAFSCPLTRWRIVCGRHKWLMTSCIEVACQQSRRAAARSPVASVEILCTLCEPLCMKHTLWTLSIRPNTFHVRLENIYKSLPTVTVIAGPNPVHCRCRSWCESKTHKPTHIPECVSLPCLHKTVMSEIFLCSLNTWSLQFGEMAAWISILEACPDTVLSSRLPTVSAHTLQLCEPTVLLSQAWVGTGVLTLPSPPAQYFIMSYHSPVKDQRQDYCVLPTPGSGQNNGNTSQTRISALKNVNLLKSTCLLSR